MDEKLWKRVCAETTTEIYLLAENWKYLLAGLILQVLYFDGLPDNQTFDCTEIYFYLVEIVLNFFFCNLDNSGCFS